ncbi:MAG: hypothetical protein RLZZ396_202, partial [Planctomycetota bacterium]
MPWKNTATTDLGANLANPTVTPKSYVWLANLCLLVALACSLTTLQSTVLGQADDQLVQALLSKLRSIEKFESSTTEPNRPSLQADSSLADLPSPQRLAELLELVLQPNPSTSNRFFIADTSSRSKLRRERLRSALQSAGLLGDLESIIESHASSPSSIEATPNAQLLDRNQALLAILNTDEKNPRNSNPNA